MNYRHMILPCILAGAILPQIPAYSEPASMYLVQLDERSEFESWKRSQSQEFQDYRAELQREFDTYKRTLQEEFARYQQSIREQWDQVEVSTPEVWVEYSDDRKTKKVVDYKNNEIRIHVIEEKGRQAEQLMEEALQDVLAEKVETALEREPVMSKVEKALSSSSPVVKKAKVDDRLVLSELYDKATPSAEEIKQKASELLQKAVTKKEIAKSARGQAKTEAMVVTIPLPRDRVLKKAEQYRRDVEQHAGKWNINEPLVMAVIHTESAFNPMATSYVPAYGMMQIVPRYAGKEAAEKLWGEPKLLAPSYLYNAQNNIEIGTVYLNILYYRYFQAVKDPESRLFCAISAYNTGPGNVARAFTGSRNLTKAIPVINGMSTQQVYQRLRNHLPYEETRDYVQKVSRRMKSYQGL